MKQVISIGFLWLIAWMGVAETVKDREGAVRGDKARLEGAERWNYEDIEGGFRQAREAGKPLLVVLRCIPCLACAGLDAGVLDEGELAPLLDRFVCVRAINANALDLKKFQFDYDLSFSIMMFHADGTVLARFGSWDHQKNPEERDTAGLKRALEEALELHGRYPGNRASLAGKQGGPVPYATPIEFPSLAGKYQSKLDWNGKVVASCVHCHMVGDAFRAQYRSQNLAIPEEWIFPHPSLAALGARLTGEGSAQVAAVTPDSPAAKSGLKAGDWVIEAGGQRLVSAADLSWALHRAPATGSWPVSVRRGEDRIETRLDLASGWRGQSDISRRVGTWPMRAMALGGLQLEDLAATARVERGLPPDGMALRVVHAGEYGEHAAAKNAGFRKDDVIVQVGDWRDRLTESALIGRLLRDHRPGERLKSVVWRGSDRVELSLPQQ